MISDYLLFLAKTLTVLGAVLVLLNAFSAQRRKGGPGAGALRARRLNSVYRQRRTALEALSQPSDLRSRIQGRLRKKAALGGNSDRADPLGEDSPRIFVLDFEGDVRARAVEALREEISAILTTARPGTDEVVLRMESPGGVVPAYGLAASQLVRLRDADVRLTVCVDRVAASGGYLMAAVADRIIAAPFALVGSIGVVGQLPNFHRWLRKHDIDFEQQTAGDHKRTLTVFGENTDEAREKFQEDLESIHGQFKAFVQRFRPGLDVDRVATGEFWLAERALELGLVDALQTSDDYLMGQRDSAHLLALHYHRKEGWSRRLAPIAERMLGWLNR